MKVDLDCKLAGFVMVAAAIPATSAANDSFNLLCYSTTGTFGGAELYCKEGFIMVSNLTSPDNLTSIYFTRDRDAVSASWTVSANTTRSPNVSCGDGALLLPADNNSTHPEVTVTDSSNGSTNMLLYGQSAFAHVNGSYKNPFYAAATEDVGIWRLLWNPTDPDNLTPVVLRSI